MYQQIYDITVLLLMSHNCLILAQLSASVQSRFESELTAEFFQVAAAIHPRFKLAWIEKSDDRVALQEKMRLVLTKYGGQQQTQPNNPGLVAGELQNED